MQRPPAAHSTFTLDRVLAKPPPSSTECADVVRQCQLRGPRCRPRWPTPRQSMFKPYQSQRRHCLARCRISCSYIACPACNDECCVEITALQSCSGDCAAYVPRPCDTAASHRLGVRHSGARTPRARAASHALKRSGAPRVQQSHLQFVASAASRGPVGRLLVVLWRLSLLGLRCVAAVLEPRAVLRQLVRLACAHGCMLTHLQRTHWAHTRTHAR